MTKKQTNKKFTHTYKSQFLALPNPSNKGNRKIPNRQGTAFFQNFLEFVI